DVAPRPVLAGFEAPHDGMLGFVKVLGGVSVGGVVAAADVTAFETEPQMHPPLAALEAFFPAVRRLGGKLCHVGKMLSMLVHRFRRSLSRPHVRRNAE